MKKKAIHLILIEEDEHLHAMIADQLKQTTLKLSARYALDFPMVNLFDYKDAHAFLKSLSPVNNLPAYLFIDFDGKYGESGAYLIQVAKEKFKNIRLILMAGSKNAIFNTKHVFDVHDVYDYVIRDNYAPAVCALLLEQYIEKAV